MFCLAEYLYVTLQHAIPLRLYMPKLLSILEAIIVYREEQANIRFHSHFKGAIRAFPLHTYLMAFTALLALLLRAEHTNALVKAKVGHELRYDSCLRRHFYRLHGFFERKCCDAIYAYEGMLIFIYALPARHKVYVSAACGRHNGMNFSIHLSPLLC